MALYNELKRRNVLRVGAVYIVAAWLVIQVVETIFPAFGFGDSAIRIVVIVLAIAFIPSLVLSWVFEITPEGMKREVDVVRDDSTTYVTGKRLDRIIMVLLALALGYFAFDKFVLDPQREVVLQRKQAVQLVSVAEQSHEAGRREALAEPFDDKSIAVLPFVNMSSDGEQEYFSDGISEELINLLTEIPELRVIARTSAFSYKGKDVRLSQIADELKVNHILEGSVRKAGDRVRITAQLIDAGNEAHLWSETYDRTLDDIFIIQDEIAASVVEQLKVTLLGSQRKAQEINPEAYALWLQAQHLLQFGAEENRAQGYDLLEQAVAIEPNYAAAQYYLTWQASDGIIADDWDVYHAREIEKFLETHPDFAPAHAHLGLHSLLDYDLATAASYYQRAQELEPTRLSVLRTSILMLIALDRLDEAIQVAEYVALRDPLDIDVYQPLGFLYGVTGHLENAVDSMQTMKRLNPNLVYPELAIGETYLRKGEAQTALDIIARVEKESMRWPGGRLQVTAMALHTLGRQEEYETILSELIRDFGGQNPESVAQVYAWVGDADSCFAWLDKAIDHGGALFGNRLSHVYDSVRADPRWVVFNQRIGRSPEQLAAIEFKVTLPK